MSRVGDHARELYDDALTWPAQIDAADVSWTPSTLKASAMLLGNVTVVLDADGNRVEGDAIVLLDDAGEDGSADA